MTNAQSTLLRTPLGLLVIIFCCSILSGCSTLAVRLDYTPGAYEKPDPSQAVELVVTDKRPYVLDGKETSAFVGHIRGGYGNPWAYTTQGKTPLAKQMDADLTQELTSLGFSGCAPGTSRKLNVAIHDFNFDAYKGGKFWYEVYVTVSDASNTVLAEKTIKEQHLIRGRFMEGAHSAILEQVPVLYNELIRKMVRENPKILQTLKQSGK